MKQNGGPFHKDESDPKHISQRDESSIVKTEERSEKRGDKKRGQGKMNETDRKVK
jgi:hypothetical protein